MPGIESILTSGAGTTLSSAILVSRIRQEFGQADWQDVLTSDYTAADLSMSVGYPTKWSVGNLLDPDDGTGSLYRVSADPTGNPITVQASQGSTDANHPSGTVLIKDPQYTTIGILNAINAALADINGKGIYYTKAFTVTPPTSTPTTQVYAVPADWLGLARAGISQQVNNSTTTDVTFYDSCWYEVLSNVPVGLAGTTKAIRFNTFENTAHDVYVFYHAGITTTNIVDGDIARLVVLTACKILIGDVDVSTAGRSQAAKRIAKGANIIKDASWYDREATILRSRIRAQLKDTSPRSRTYVR